MDAKAVDAGLKELAGRLGIGHLLSALPDKLSIGERAAGRHSAGAAAETWSSCSPTSPPPRWTP